MMHYPFDDGALHWLGQVTHQKTIKAACGKRVAFALADADASITCDGCRTELNAKIESCRGLLEHGGEVERIATQEIHRLAAIVAR